MTLYDRLIEFKDDEYRRFQTKLVPNIPADKVLGIRTPQMRKIAKEVFESDFTADFLGDLPHKYYEENLIHFFVLAMIKDFDECVRMVEAFLPYVDCWPVSDQASPKAFKKDHQKLLPYIKKWISSDHVYTARFGIRMLMNEFLGEIAWFFATALAKRYDETVKYFENRRLDEWVHKKAIQKATESFRVTDEHKEYLRSLR